MRVLLKWLARVAAVLLGLLALAALGLYLATSDIDPVPATVVTDPDLPAIDILDVRLHAESFGPENGAPIIVLHGGPGDDYRSLLPLRALADDGYRILFYDQRGAGLSERLPAEALTLATHLAELDAVANSISPEAPVVLIGHSWGAMLASAYLGAHPTRVSRAVLIEPGFLSAAEGDAFFAAFEEQLKAGMARPAFLWQFLRARFQALHVDGPDDHARADFTAHVGAHLFYNLPDHPFHCPDAPFDSPSWRTGGLASQAVPSQASREDLDSLGAVDGFTGPVLLVSGGCDAWLGAALQEAHAALFANARHVTVPDAGHDVIDDQPDAALALIRDFLR